MKKPRHKWKYADGGRSACCEQCGIKYRLVDRKSKGAFGGTTGDAQYMINGEWKSMRSVPPCGNATKTCPKCGGSGVVGR